MFGEELKQALIIILSICVCLSIFYLSWRQIPCLDAITNECIIIVVKTIPLSIGMARLPFPKLSQKLLSNRNNTNFIFLPLRQIKLENVINLIKKDEIRLSNDSLIHFYPFLHALHTFHGT